MPVVFQYRLFSTPTALLKTLVLSSAVVATVVLSGCASKPQVNNSHLHTILEEHGGFLDFLAIYKLNYI